MRKRIRHILFPLMMSCIFMIQGCMADHPGNPPEMPIEKGLKVSARKADHVYTRNYKESGIVESGKYYLSYPNNTDRNYTVAEVDFDKMAVESPGLGIVNTLSGSELKWSDIGGSPVNFYLDNVSWEYGEGPEVIFSDNYNPFVAGVFDFEGGSNDLLWGEKTANTGTKSLGFDLHHNMSRVKIQVEVVHKDVSVEKISLSDATVRITNLYPRPASYNRITGNLTLDTGGNTEGEGILIMAPETNKKGYSWKEINESDPDRTIYISQDIVLPPQSPAEDYTRSRLEITLPNGDMYYGILPHAMLIAGSNDTDNGGLNYPVNLSFLKEYILTIRTVITEEPPELAFMPVWVTEWVDKGEFTLEAHQSRVYTASEFYKLIRYYETHNEYQLERYGYLDSTDESDSEFWYFNFFGSVSLKYNDIFRKMVPGTVVGDKGETKDFTFAFNNYSVFVYNDNEDDAVKVNEEQLNKIVKGQLNWQQIHP